MVDSVSDAVYPRRYRVDMKTWAAYALRLPPELKLVLEAAAQENGRSLNAEIVYRLQKSLTTYRQL